MGESEAASDAKKRRRRPVLRDVKMELLGPFRDATHKSLGLLLRGFRERYIPLMRHFVISTPPLGPDDGAPRREVLIEATPIRLLQSEADAPASGTMTIAELTRFFEIDLLGLKLTSFHPRFREDLDCGDVSAMTTGVATRPTPPIPTGIGRNELVVKQYFHEPLRFSSFLVGVKGGAAVLIDPLVGDLCAKMKTDAAQYGMRIVAAIALSWHFDVVTADVRAEFGPDVVRIDPRTAGAAADASLPLGRIRFTPWLGEVLGWSRDGAAASIVEETVHVDVLLADHVASTNDALHCGFPFISAALRVGDTGVAALFCGDLMGVDCVGRVDITRTVNAVVANLCDGARGDESAIDPAAAQVHALLKMVHHRGVDDSTVLFPAHGNYNDVTRALDLHWAIHINDLKRQPHTKPLMDILLGSRSEKMAVDELHNIFSKNRALGGDKLPFHDSWIVNYVTNCGWLPKADGHERTAKLERLLHAIVAVRYPHITTGDELTAALNRCSTLLLDIRPWSEYRAVTLGSSVDKTTAVNIPMDPRTETLGSRKAEVWLIALLQRFFLNPTNPSATAPLVVVHSDDAQKERFAARLGAIGLAHVAASASYFAAAKLNITTPQAPDLDMLRHKVDVRCDHLSSSAQQRLATHEELRLMDRCFTSAPDAPVLGAACRRVRHAPANRHVEVVAPDTLEPLSLIIDIRTPFEHRNGAHRHAIHWPLADIIELFYSPFAAAQRATVVASQGAFLKYLAEKAISQGLVIHSDIRAAVDAAAFSTVPISKLVFYCAAGYRSHIAISIVRNVFPPGALSFEPVDLMGGALQVMKQRPDLWQIKDRSILCIS